MEVVVMKIKFFGFDGIENFDWDVEKFGNENVVFVGDGVFQKKI